MSEWTSDWQDAGADASAWDPANAALVDRPPDTAPVIEFLIDEAWDATVEAVASAADYVTDVVTEVGEDLGEWWHDL